MIEIVTLLQQNPTWAEVVEFFKHGEFEEERYLVAAIKRHLLTEDQKQRMAAIGLSIEDMLNGRYYANQEEVVEDILAEWNEKLGFHNFGF